MRPATTSGGAAAHDYRVPPRLADAAVRQRQIEFAWGPTPRPHAATHAPRRARDRGRQRRGKGSVCVDRLELRELPPSAAMPAPWRRRPRAPATSRARRRRPVRDRLAAAARRGAPSSADARLRRAARVRRRSSLRWRAGAHTRRATRRAVRRRRALAHAYAASTARAATLQRALAARRRGALRPPQRRRARRASDVALPSSSCADRVGANAFFAALAASAPRGRYPRASRRPAVVLDRASASTAAQRGAAQRGRHARRCRARLDRAVPASSTASSLTWADAQHHPVAARRRPADPVGALAQPATALDIAAFGDGTPDARAGARALHASRNLRQRARRRDARAGAAAVPGQPADAVSRPRRAARADPRRSRGTAAR